MKIYYNVFASVYEVLNEELEVVKVFPGNIVGFDEANEFILAEVA